MHVSILFTLLGSALGQQIYLSAQGTSVKTSCTVPLPALAATPTYRLDDISFTPSETVRTATGVSKQPSATYGPCYAAVSQLFANQSTTSWGNWQPSATVKPTDTANPYDQAAWSGLWESASVLNFTRGLYSTTVSPTPLPTSSLVLPPPLNFGPDNCYNFPKDFIYGVSGSAAQVEGAVADEGRSPSLPDVFNSIYLSRPKAEVQVRFPSGTVQDDFTTLENYYLYKHDIDRLAAVGMKWYSFSMAWTRILPFVFPGTPLNSHGLKHYDDLINYILAKGMLPAVTLIHNDTPLPFFGENVTESFFQRSYLGYQSNGYQNKTFEDAFVSYGKIVMAHFADRVPIWVTYNEPQIGSVGGQSVNTIVRSHARLHHFYHETLNGTGKMSLKSGAWPYVPLDPRNASHVAAARHQNDLMIGTLFAPLARGEDYPEAFKMTIQDYVPLSEADLRYLNGTVGM